MPRGQHVDFIGLIPLRSTGLDLAHPFPQLLSLPIPDFLVVDLLSGFAFPLALARRGGGFVGPHTYRDGLDVVLAMLLHHGPLDLFFRVVPFDRAVFDLVPVGCEEAGVSVRENNHLQRGIGRDNTILSRGNVPTYLAAKHQSAPFASLSIPDPRPLHLLSTPHLAGVPKA